MTVQKGAVTRHKCQVTSVKDGCHDDRRAGAWWALLAWAGFGLAILAKGPQLPVLMLIGLSVSRRAGPLQYVSYFLVAACFTGYFLALPAILGVAGIRGIG